MPPVIVKPLKDTDTPEKVPFELACEVSGTPKPEVAWYIKFIIKFSTIYFFDNLIM